jgi:hypothetical protein
MYLEIDFTEIIRFHEKKACEVLDPIRAVMKNKGLNKFFLIHMKLILFSFFKSWYMVADHFNLVSKSFIYYKVTTIFLSSKYLFI